MGIRTNASLGFVTALDELYGLGLNNYKKYSANIDEVTKDDIRRLAEKYLNIKKGAVLVVRPRRDPGTE